MLSDLAQHDQMLYEKRREASQATLDAAFWKASLPEASASDEPPTSNEPPANDEPQLSTSTGGFTHTSIPSSSLLGIDNPDVV